MALQLLKESVQDFLDDDCPSLAAALAYYTIFALPALLVLILLIVGLFVDPGQVQQALQGQLGSLMGSEAEQGIGTIIAQADNPATNRGVAWAIGIGGLIFSATGAFGQLQKALNRAWEVEPDPEQGGVKNFIFKRVLSLGMILSIAFLLLVTLMLSAALQGFGDAVAGLMGGASSLVLRILDIAVSFVVVTLLFAAMFKILPDAVVAWRDVWVGAIGTTVLFAIGRFLIGFYVGRSNPGEAFGAAASLAVLLVWTYYASMILLFGAEFTQKWAERRGAGIQPEPGAVRVIEEKKHLRSRQ